MGFDRLTPSLLDTRLGKAASYSTMSRRCFEFLDFLFMDNEAGRVESQPSVLLTGIVNLSYLDNLSNFFVLIKITSLALWLV